MKFKFIFGLFILLMMNFVIAQGEFCVDFDDPTAPSNLEVASSEKNIILSWNVATDIPDCSGIDYYVISRDGSQIGTTSPDTLTYTDENVDYGTYSYSVYAVDKVSHNSGLAIKNDVVLSEPTNGGGGNTRVGGGGRGTSYICEEMWDCSKWTACHNGRQTRTCTDLAECGTTKLKPIITRACSVEETKTYYRFEDNECATVTISIESKGSNDYEEEADCIANITPKPSFIVGITGAVIGTLGAGGTIVVLVFIIGLVTLAITVRIIRKRKS